MKRIKKLAALLLAMIMVLSMTLTAFASESDEFGTGSEVTDENVENEENEEVTNPTGPVYGEKPNATKQEYKIYQIFTGDYSDRFLSNVKWGKNGVGEPGADVAVAVLEELEDLAHVHDDIHCSIGDDGSCTKKLGAEYSDVEKLEAIKKYATLTKTEDGKEVDADPYTTSAGSLTGLEAGYYLVKGTVTYSDGQFADTLYVVNVVDENDEITITPKVDVPTSTKKIVDNNNRVDENDAAIGDTVVYEITGTLPSNYDSYNEYYYVFTDTLSKGLTLKVTDGIKVTVDGTEVTGYFYKEVSDYNSTSGTTIIVGIQNLKWLDELAGITVTADSKIVITYNAELNENAVIGGPNKNDVKLEYSNNPNDSGDGKTNPPDEPEKPEPNHPIGKTPEDTVETYTTELAILKTDEKGTIEPVKGAEFTLTGESVKVSLVTTEKFEADENGAYWKLVNGSYTLTPPVTADDETNNEDDYVKENEEYVKYSLVRTIEKATDANGTQVKAIVGEDGRITFTGLGEGTYTITETKTPAGYNTIKPITFTVSFDNEYKSFSTDNEEIIVGMSVNNTLQANIVNQKGSLLPSTGGIGTTIFYVVGGILVIGAGIILVAKKRMGKR